MFSKKMCNLHIYTDGDDRNHDLLRLRLYCTPASTHLLCQHTFATYYQKILFKNPGLSVVSNLRNVLRHKQGRLTM